MTSIETEQNHVREAAFDSMADALYRADGGINEAQLLQESDNDWRSRQIIDKCHWVRRVIVTPTKCIFRPMELMVGNRILRKYGEEYALRLVFRTDSDELLRASSDLIRSQGRIDEGLRDIVCDVLERNCIRRTLSPNGGIIVGERRYTFLAWSSSQLRDQGAYLFAPVPADRCRVVDANRQAPYTPDDIRAWIGVTPDASLTAPKYMSRMALSLTQAVETIELTEKDYIIEDDITGGKDPYGKDDGCGRVSQSLAMRILDAHVPPISPMRGAIQVRCFTGIKGMLSVCVPFVAPWKRVSDGDSEHFVGVVFRNSMAKHRRQTRGTLEVVNFSGPSAMYMSRQLINILDQVSALESEAHVRVRRSVHSLLDNQLFTLADMLFNDNLAAQVLEEETYCRYLFQELHDVGISLTNEPFMRSLLLATHEHVLAQRLVKMKLPLPPWMGRNMKGVLDETGLLQYGEVFVQYSPIISQPSNPIQSYTGKVLISKNPMMVGGDVRLFNAVYKEALAHLVDIVVFSQVGPRPPADQMAGSDLDGDEFIVIFDSTLHTPCNVTPLVYATEPGRQTYPPLKSLDDAVDFFVDQLYKNNIGVFGNRHLAASDYYGLSSKVSNELAKKNAEMVDFPKTGVLPAEFSGQEVMRYWPDFFGKSAHKLTYPSTRLVGQLHRKIEAVFDAVRIVQSEAGNRDYEPDERLLIDRTDILLRDEPELMQQYSTLWKEARSMCAAYNSELKAICDAYSVSNEAAIVTGKLTLATLRLSRKEIEVESKWNTERMVELRFSQLCDKYRAKFWQKYGGEARNVLDENARCRRSRVALDVQEKMGVMLEASLWYRAAYTKQYNSTGFLSFGWLMSDCLCALLDKRERQKHSTAARANPWLGQLGDALTYAMLAFDKMVDTWRERRQSSSNERALKKYVVEATKTIGGDALVKQYMERYGRRLRPVITALLHWAFVERILDAKAWAQTEYGAHLVRVVIGVAIGQCRSARLQPPEDAIYLRGRAFESNYQNQLARLPKLNDKITAKSDERYREVDEKTYCAQLLLETLRYLSSYDFYRAATVPHDSNDVSVVRKEYEIDCDGDGMLRIDARVLRAATCHSIQVYHHLAYSHAATALHLCHATEASTTFNMLRAIAADDEAAVWTWDSAEMSPVLVEIHIEERHIQMLLKLSQNLELDRLSDTYEEDDMAHRRQHDRLKQMLDDLHKRGTEVETSGANVRKLEPMERWSPGMRARVALKLKRWSGCAEVLLEKSERSKCTYLCVKRFLLYFPTLAPSSADSAKLVNETSTLHNLLRHSIEEPPPNALYDY